MKTVVLFFEKGAPTRKIWYYQLDPGRNLGKTNPLNDDDLAEFVKLQKSFADSPKSWSMDAKSIDQTTFDLSVKNPNGGEEVAHRSPAGIMDEIVALDAESAEVLEEIQGAAMKNGWQTRRCGDLCEIIRRTLEQSRSRFGERSKWLVSGDIDRRRSSTCEADHDTIAMDNASTQSLLPRQSVLLPERTGQVCETVGSLRTSATGNQRIVCDLLHTTPRI